MGQIAIPEAVAAILRQVKARDRAGLTVAWRAFAALADGTGTVRGYSTGEIARLAGVPLLKSILWTTDLERLRLIRKDGFARSRKPRSRFMAPIWVVVHLERAWLAAVEEGGL